MKMQTPIISAPGRALTNYPHGPEPFTKLVGCSCSATDNANATRMLGSALAQEHLINLPGTPLILKDQYERVMMSDGDEKSVWNYAYWAKLDKYPIDVRGVIFSRGDGGFLTYAVGDKTKTLLANQSGTGNSWAIWGDDSIVIPSYTKASTSMEWIDKEHFRLYYSVNNTKMYLKGGAGGDWNWAFWERFDGAIPSQVPLLFTANQHYYLSSDLVKALLLANLPSAESVLKFYGADGHYCLLDDALAKLIWRNGDLGGKKWTPSKFDCDDFAFVYKGECSLQSYKNGDEVPYGYAVGFIWGTNAVDGHAVNVYVNYQGKVMVLEPQTGEIFDASRWGYNPYLACF